MMDQLDEALSEFDGKHVARLRAVVDAFDPAQAERLMRVCENGVARETVAASWVIKAVGERGNADAFDWPRLFRVLETAPDWECALHLLQSVQHVADGPTDAQIRPWLDHTRLLVRVWALDAFVRLALHDDALRDEARARIATAQADGPASLRARARALEKLLD